MAAAPNPCQPSRIQFCLSMFKHTSTGWQLSATSHHKQPGSRSHCSSKIKGCHFKHSNREHPACRPDHVIPRLTCLQLRELRDGFAHRLLHIWGHTEKFENLGPVGEFGFN